ncbi:hypothetical protein ACJX0J_039156, partial [Zea mays]
AQKDSSKIYLLFLIYLLLIIVAFCAAQDMAAYLHYKGAALLTVSYPLIVKSAMLQTECLFPCIVAQIAKIVGMFVAKPISIYHPRPSIHEEYLINYAWKLVVPVCSVLKNWGVYVTSSIFHFINNLCIYNVRFLFACLTIQIFFISTTCLLRILFFLFLFPCFYLIFLFSVNFILLIFLLSFLTIVNYFLYFIFFICEEIEKTMMKILNTLLLLKKLSISIYYYMYAWLDGMMKLVRSGTWTREDQAAICMMAAVACLKEA